MPKYRHTLQFRLLVLGMFLVTLGVSVRMLVGMPYLQSQVQELVGSQLMAIASYAANDVEQQMASRKELVGVLARGLPSELLQRPPALHAWLAERQQINPLFSRGLMVVGLDGRLIAEYPVVPGRKEIPFENMDWFIKAVNSDRIVLGKPALSLATGDPRLVMAAPVRDASGKPVAILAGAALPSTPGFLDLDIPHLGAAVGLLLVSPADGVFVASSSPEMVFRSLPPPGTNPLHDRAMAGFRGVGVTVNAFGAEELSAIASIPGMDWFVVARMPTTEVFRPVDMLRSFAWKSSLASMLLLVVVLCLALPRMFRPLSEIAQEMQRMACGERPLQPLPERRADEVGDVVAGFNHLVAQLTDKEKALEASRERLDFLAHHDPLTRLPNRMLLEDRLEQGLRRAERSRSEIALLFCDLDGFKAVNDRFGHEAGDRILCEVAERLCDGRRRADTVARLGGDEFVILLCDLEDAAAAARVVAEQCLQAIALPFAIDSHEIHLGISIGIAVHRGENPGAAHLLSEADSAMYEAKKSGKGRFAFYSA